MKAGGFLAGLRPGLSKGPPGSSLGLAGYAGRKPTETGLRWRSVY